MHHPIGLVYLTLASALNFSAQAVGGWPLVARGLVAAAGGSAIYRAGAQFASQIASVVKKGGTVLDVIKAGRGHTAEFLSLGNEVLGMINRVFTKGPSPSKAKAAGRASTFSGNHATRYPTAHRAKKRRRY